MTAPTPALDLSADDRQHLLDVARRSVELGLLERPGRLPDLTGSPAHLRRLAATFVTLRRDGNLLGCIGSIQATRPLVDDVAHNSSAAAFADPRLPAVTFDDFVAMDVKISVLGPLERLDVRSYDDLVSSVEPNIDGLLISAGRHRGTFLPSVWDQVPDRHRFMDMLWEKAGLRPRTWPRGLVVERYRTVEFGD